MTTKEDSLNLFLLHVWHTDNQYDSLLTPKVASRIHLAHEKKNHQIRILYWLWLQLALHSGHLEQLMPGCTLNLTPPPPPPPPNFTEVHSQSRPNGSWTRIFWHNVPVTLPISRWWSLNCPSYQNEHVEPQNSTGQLSHTTACVLLALQAELILRWALVPSPVF